MLIEFRVKNFRSLRDEQVLSLVATRDKTLEDSNTRDTGLKAAPRLLHSAVIFGANASGKSNVVKALQYMRRVVLESAAVMTPGQTFAVQPFRLDKESATEPTSFEVTFMIGDVRYQYGFAMTQHRIVSEHLLVYKASKSQRWFERHFDTERGKDIYEFGSGWRGSKHLWEGATRPDALFLSMAVLLNSEALRPAFDWFEHGLVIYNEQSQFNPQATINMLEQPAGKQRIGNFLAAADIEAMPGHTLGQTGHFDLVAGKTELRNGERAQHQFRFSHRTDAADAVFGLMDESNGTRNLVFLAGPILGTLQNGITLVVDELDTSLHTLLLRQIVRLFHRPQVNTSGAQLIFTTHDASLLDVPDLFRRDQVWFVEKDLDQASALVPLSDFSLSKNEALGRGYLLGRYGGVPFLDQSSGLPH